MRLRDLVNRAIPATLLCCAGVAVATNPPTTDGQRDTEYGAALTTQVSSVISIFSPPYALTLGVDNSNVGGVAALVAGNIVSPPQDVLTGVEIKIPLAEVGWNGSDPIKVCCFVNGGGSDFLSNQVSGGLDPLAVLPAGIHIGGGAIPIFNFGGPDATPAPGFDYSAGTQYVTITQTQANVPATIDGTLDGTLDGAPYGPFLYENLLNPTSFGDSTSGSVDIGSGSEIDAIRGYRDTLGTPATTDDILYLHIAGNVENNGNKFDVFIDAWREPESAADHAEPEHRRGLERAQRHADVGLRCGLRAGLLPAVQHVRQRAGQLLARSVQARHVAGPRGVRREGRGEPAVDRGRPRRVRPG
jgi:hypothetical protein